MTWTTRSLWIWSILKSMNDGWTSRKLHVALGCLALNTTLLLIGKLTESTYESLYMMTIGAYFVANVAEKSRLMR